MKFNSITSISLMAILILSGCGDQAGAQAKKESRNSETPAVLLTRMFWQDHSTHQLKWCELYDVGGKYVTETPQVVPGFPQLDPEKQGLVQMRKLDQYLVVGVRDNNDGKFASGYVVIDTGVDEQEHGDHFHYHYLHPPKVVYSIIDDKQGNPAHMYRYGDEVYIANDKLNGFTMLNTNLIKQNKPGKFFPGGGNHITMAAVDGKVAYSTWAGGDGKVDVVKLNVSTQPEISYSINIASGGLHGATANSGKVFFAPKDGVDWVNADINCSMKPDQVKINHIDLGKDSETQKPLRTGAFTSHINYVLFHTGKASDSAMCLLDANQAEPNLIRIPISLSEGLYLTTPEVIKAPGNKRYAMIFADHKDNDLAESLYIIDLDPDNNKNFSDAKIHKQLTVGKSLVEGHSGHHSIAFTSDQKRAVITNPGDGSLMVIDLKDLEIKQTLSIQGEPNDIICAGGKDNPH